LKIRNTIDNIHIHRLKCTGVYIYWNSILSNKSTKTIVVKITTLTVALANLPTKSIYIRCSINLGSCGMWHWSWHKSTRIAIWQSQALVSGKICLPRYYIYYKVCNRSFVKNLGHRDFRVFSTRRTPAWRNGLHHLKLR
jgi:hypothetical protein